MPRREGRGKKLGMFYICFSSRKVAVRWRMNSRSDVDVENRINEVKSDNTEKWGSRIFAKGNLP